MRGGETTKTQEKKQEQDWMKMMLVLMLMMIDGNEEEQKNKKHDRACVLLAQTYWSIAIPPNCRLCARCQIRAAQSPSEKEPGRLIPSDLGDMEEPFVAHTVGSYCRMPVRYKAQRTSSWPPLYPIGGGRSVSACRRETQRACSYGNRHKLKKGNIGTIGQ